MSPSRVSISTSYPADRVDSPLAMRHIPFEFDSSDPEKSALELVQELDPSWRTEEGPIVFVRFTEGITNTLMKATKKRPGRSDADNDEDAILLRAYGSGTDVLIDRERELKAHNLLANMGLAPALLARFNNGLMYRFIAGHVCTPEDLRRPEIYRQVAKRLGQWHGSLPISSITSAVALEPKVLQKHTGFKNGKTTRPSPNVWTVVQQWIDALPNVTEKEKERNAQLQTELDYLSSTLGEASSSNGNRYVFAHCDLLSGNVIVTRSEANSPVDADKPVSFIDYEYATPAPAAFDIANHFAEWAGFECDHTAVPTKSQRYDFIQHYIASYHDHFNRDQKTRATETDVQRDVDQLNDQVNIYRGVPGFYWGIWALIQAQISQIDFDYASYAELRLGEYWAWKRELDGSRQRDGQEMSVRERRWAAE